MNKYIVVAVFIAVALAILFYLLYPKNIAGKEVKVKIGIQEWHVELTKNDWTRAMGLSGRKFLGENDGMLFVFNRPNVQRFWMRDMKFPLDIIWIDNNKVVGVAENLPPASFNSLKTYASPVPVRFVLEVNAGSAQKFGINVGNEVFIYENNKLILY